MEVMILGAGYHLKKYGFEVTLYEKEKEVGGLCRSIRGTNELLNGLVWSRDRQN